MTSRDRTTSRTAPPPGAVPLLPAAAFVLVWSSGYIAGPAGVDVVEPFTLLTLRFGVAALLLAPLAWWLRGPMRMTRHELLRVGAVGLVLNAIQFGLMYVGFALGLGATLAALLHSLSPVLTVVLAGLLLGERLTRVQVAGFAAGVVGVLVVLGPDVDGAGGWLGLGLGVASLLALSLGTLGQRWIHVSADPIWSATVQCAVATVPLGLVALAFEGTGGVQDPGQGLVAVLYLAAVNSVAGLLLLGVLVRRGGASAGASVFFLMPPVTAVLAWVAFGDTLGPRQVIGLALSVVGVAVATRAGRARRLTPRLEEPTA
ncbi:putative amino-acid metabolite efflux pump [Nocardioides dokdonensis FR1436]|uniref:Putative amino-acid metabolite efflux pump n=1 Tax=Nocardioides dokdonensis FR1436 TaxID=1300347 RepID=A0A1A9GM61_9ACTN|nr:DMT family transporter [Nocardioides dokdonensis]ANH38571.1 putative amino-acid metabolite efflux pump [Nocardioides dokdonensis FR1436]